MKILTFNKVELSNSVFIILTTKTDLALVEIDGN